MSAFIVLRQNISETQLTINNCAVELIMQIKLMHNNSQGTSPKIVPRPPFNQLPEDDVAEMYSAVPPPEQVQAGAQGEGEEDGTKGEEDKPVHVLGEQWKRFQSLKARRKKECEKSTQQRIATARRRALKTEPPMSHTGSDLCWGKMSHELTVMDKAILESEGVCLPGEEGQRKRKQRRDGVECEMKPEARDGVEGRWCEVKRYLDPNPQLKGVDLGRYAAKSKLEDKMDAAIEKGEFGEASAISDRLAQREFATQVATAFDCHDYIKRRKFEEERKSAEKPKLKWRFEHKQRWESKGSM